MPREFKGEKEPDFSMSPTILDAVNQVLFEQKKALETEHHAIPQLIAFSDTIPIPSNLPGFLASETNATLTVLTPLKPDTASSTDPIVFAQEFYDSLKLDESDDQRAQIIYIPQVVSFLHGLSQQALEPLPDRGTDTDFNWSLDFYDQLRVLLLNPSTKARIVITSDTRDNGKGSLFSVPRQDHYPNAFLSETEARRYYQHIKRSQSLPDNFQQLYQLSMGSPLVLHYLIEHEDDLVTGLDQALTDILDANIAPENMYTARSLVTAISILDTQQEEGDSTVFDMLSTLHQVLEGRPIIDSEEYGQTRQYADILKPNIFFFLLNNRRENPETERPNQFILDPIVRQIAYELLLRTDPELAVKLHRQAATNYQKTIESYPQSPYVEFWKQRLNYHKERIQALSI